MKKFRRAGSSMLNTLAGLFTPRQRASAPGRLARRAGAAEMYGLEQLEERRLLFTLTIGPDQVDPTTGLGTVTAQFGYVIPYLFAPIPDPVAPVTVVEEFADEMGFWTQGVPAIPPSGTFFEGSDIRISYATQAAGAVRLVPGPDPGMAGANDLDLRIQLQVNDQVTFSFFDGVQENNPTPRLTTFAAFTIRAATLATELPGDGDGLRTTDDGTRISLLRNGQVVATFLGAQLAALGTPVVGGGVRFDLNFAAGFDAVRFSSAQTAPDNALYQDIFVLDDITVVYPPGRFTDFISNRIFGVSVSFTGPAGASVQFLDLYGRDIQRRIDLGAPEGVDVPNVDPNDDGVPDFNDGIGRVIISGSNALTNLTMIGGVIDNQMGFTFAFPDDFLGLYDAFEDAGFGYALSNTTPPQVIGLPPGPGSLIIGSPFVRNNATPGQYLAQPTFTQAGFVRGDQGIFVSGGASMGSVVVHGIVHGSSQFTGALERYNAGLQLGSVSVAGDLGSFIVAGDASMWVRDDNFAINPTNAQLVVGRTAREIAIGGRSSLDINVQGDINNANRPRLDFLTYFEREVMYRFTGDETDTFGATLNANPNRANQAVFFVDGFFRNDSLLSAEFIGYNGTAARIVGSLGGGDPINTGFDSADVFAFPADPTREVVIQGDGARYFRVVDRDGRPLAASDLGAPGRGPNGNNLGLSVIRFRPDYADVYYLVVNAPGGDVGTTTPYDLTIVGMAPVTLGALRVVSGAGGFNDPFFLSLGAGSMGSVRIGTGFIDGSQMEGDPTAVLNNNQNIDDLFNYSASTVTVPGDLYNITTGSDINGAQVLVGRDLGVLVTGQSPAVGIGVTQGDLTNGDIRAGRRIGILDIRGALASDQDPDPDSRAGIVNIRSGTTGQPGHIGQILVGAYVNGLGLTVITSNFSIIDQFIVGNNNGGAGSEFPGGQIINGTPVFRMGTGSDLRFADFNLIQRGADTDVVTPLVYNTPITFVDDGGATFSVRIRGGGPNAFLSTATIRVLPIDGSQGVAFARINADLQDGAELVFTGLTPGVVSIGRLNITSTSNLPSIIFNGVAEMDVWRIDVTGTPLNVIRNETQRGDIVAIDAAALREVRIGTGSLGRTQTSGAGPSRLGPWLGLAQGRQGGVGGPLGVNGQAIDGVATEGADWDGSIFVDITNPDYDPPSPLEDLGSPIDGWLDGVVVRGGDLRNVDVGGTVGDVIVEAGHLLRLVANSDGVAAPGVFEGIEGNVYAVAINVINVGMGLRGSGASPFAAAGIFADDDIVLVTGTNAVISGVIIAGNIVAAPRDTIGTEDPVGLPNAVFGLNNVTLTNGRFQEAYIQAGPIDDFWLSNRVRDVNYYGGNVRLVRAINSDLFGTWIRGTSITEVTITGGVYDASFLSTSGSIGTVSADAFRNSTRLGRPDEIRVSRIEASLNAQNIQTNGQNGDMSDLDIDLGGRLFGAIAARNIVRVSIAVNNEIFNVLARNDLRASTIVSGSLRNLTVGGDIRSSSFSIAGPILQIIAAGEITLTEILSTGPDGRIDLIRSQGRMQGVVQSSGPIGTIESVGNDVDMSITTTDASDGTLGTLRAGRDLLVDLTILNDATTIVAGRNIGRRTDGRDRALDIRGNLGNVTATTGQIYNDILVGQNITGTVRAARVSATPINDLVSVGNIVAFGRINAVQIDGDWAGDIISYSGGIGSILITNGSFRKGYRVFAGDGNITSITIRGGHLLGNVEADGSIGSIQVLRGDDGFLGHIGVANALRPNRPFGPSDGQRNQLPPGTIRTAAIDGPQIRARTTIGSIVTDGSVWEAGIFAGESIGTVSATRFGNDGLTRGQNTFIAAGDFIQSVVGATAGGLIVISGVVDLGADNRVGGQRNTDNYDVIRSGDIGSVVFTGKVANTRIVAGISAAPGGRYGNANNRTGPGVSSIANVSVGPGSVGVKAFADGFIGTTAGNIQRNAGGNLASSTPDLIASPSISAVPIAAGAAFNLTLPGTGERASVLFNGPGEVFWDASQRRIVFRNTTSASNITVTALDGTLTSLSILGANNAVLGAVTVNGTLQGASSVYADGALGNATFGVLNTTGTVGSGGDIQTFTAGSFPAGHLLARDLRSFRVNGALGTTTSETEQTVVALNIGTVSILGVFAGNISSDREVTSFDAGSMNRAGLRAGKIIRAFRAGTVTDSRVSARDEITTVNVTGDVDGSAFLAGVDLGIDAKFGNTINQRRAADVVTDGVIGQVLIGGNFRRSDISAGVLRGVDGFLGTSDDRADDGRSSIGSVTIVGTQTGSQFNSQQFRVISTGTIGPVRVGGADFESAGNFRVTRLTAGPVPVQVVDLQVNEVGRVYVATLQFNQAIDSSTLSPALSIFEVRSGGGVLIGLAEGVDYVLAYDPATLRATVSFSTLITSRNLPVAPGVPGPGVYRFVLDANVLRGASQSSRLDGNGDGVTGDDFSADDIVGDAGDKINAGNPASDPTIDFYGAIDLDLVLDNNYTSDGLPDTNRVYTIRGSIGDHPDANATTFRAGADVDVYRVTLRAGQILRLGGMQGVAQRASRGIYDATGTLLAGNAGLGAFDPNDPFGGLFGNQFGGQSGPILSLPNAPLEQGELSNDDNYLVTVTGTYYIVIASNLAQVNIASVNAINAGQPAPGSIGNYRFDIEVFDDGDTGFRGDTDSGDGVNLVNAPVPRAFAGTDNVFGTADDQQTIVIGRYTFTLDYGPDGIPNTRDDVVRGTSTDGIVSIRRAGADGLWNTRDDVIRQTVESAIGTPGAAGNPTTVQPDIDVYHLNNGQPIAPGTRIRVTLRLTETGSNIGLSEIIAGRDRQGLTFGSIDLLGDAILGIFEVPQGTGFGDARLVAAPSEFLPIGGQDAAMFKTPQNKYGYDEQGDFFMEFIVPGAQGFGSPVPASYAIYLQGAIRSDYTLDVLTRGRGAINTAPQNVLLETLGGVIDWLEAGSGITTNIEPFNASVLGFSGQIDGIGVNDYVIQRLVANLNEIFLAANLDVRISTSPAAFEGQPFSTVFLAGNAEPSQFFNNDTFGAAQRSDSFNINKTDEAVVFLSSLGVLGIEPSQAGVDNLITQLTAAVARRIGEMAGLRMEGNIAVPVAPTPVMASNSVNFPSVFRFVDALRPLSGQFDSTYDTKFYIGFQNSLARAQQIISPRF